MQCCIVFLRVARLLGVLNPRHRTLYSTPRESCSRSVLRMQWSLIQETNTVLRSIPIPGSSFSEVDPLSGSLYTVTGDTSYRVRFLIVVDTRTGSLYSQRSNRPGFTLSSYWIYYPSLYTVLREKPVPRPFSVDTETRTGTLYSDKKETRLL